MSENSFSNLLDALTEARLFLESSRAVELQTVVQDTTASLERFLTLLNPGQLGTVIFHAKAQEVPFDGYKSLPLRIREDAKVLHALAHEKVPGLPQHPALQEFFAQWLKSFSPEETNSNTDDESGEAENQSGRIDGIAAAHFWAGEVGKLEPLVNLRLREKDGSLLLETMATFSDMVFMAHGMLGIVNDMMERLANGHAKAAVDLDLSSNTRELLLKISQQTDELEQTLGKILPPEPSPALEEQKLS